MLGKFAVTFGMCLAATVLFQPGSFITGQDEAAKQKAIDQMRHIADAIKSCPAQESRSEDECKVHYNCVGPPANVEWDVLPSKTVRSPFQGVIEFTLPSCSKDIDQVNLSKKFQQLCAKRAAREFAMAEADAPRLAEAVREGPKWREGHFRYEFDVGSAAPELIKMLWVVKGKDNNTITSAATGDERACWVTKAKSGGSTETENGSPPPKP